MLSETSLKAMEIKNLKEKYKVLMDYAMNRISTIAQVKLILDKEDPTEGELAMVRTILG